MQRRRDSRNLAESLEKSRREIRAQFRRADTDIAPVSDDDGDYTPSRPIRTGDEVYIKSVGKRGTVTHGPDAKGNVTVQTGMLTTRTNVDKLILAEDKKAPSPNSGTKKEAARDSRPSAPEGFKLEIDLRGKNGDEAWYDVDKYLDDAIMSSVRQVTLVHGKGTGALRAYLQNMLRRDSRVKSFRNGKYGEGDAGVTVVELN